MKINYKILIIILIEVMVISFYMINKIDNDNEIEVTYSKSIDCKKEDIIDGKTLSDSYFTAIEDLGLSKYSDLNRMFKINDNYVYSLNFPTNAKKMTTENKLSYADGEYIRQSVFNLLLSGFPFNTCEQMGLANDAEAYQATQLAIWEATYNTGKYNSTERARITARMEDQNNKKINSKIFNVAKKLVEEAESMENNWHSLKITSDEKGPRTIKNNDTDRKVIGPFYIDTKNINVTGGKITVQDSDGKELEDFYEIVDKYGNTIINPILDEKEVYISTKAVGYIRVIFEVQGYHKGYYILKNSSSMYIVPGVFDYSEDMTYYCNFNI